MINTRQPVLSFAGLGVAPRYGGLSSRMPCGWMMKNHTSSHLLPEQLEDHNATGWDMKWDVRKREPRQRYARSASPIRLVRRI